MVRVFVLLMAKNEDRGNEGEYCKVNKQKLRQETKKMLQGITEKEKKEIEEKIAGWLFSSPWWINSQIIGITVSKPYEWDTEKIIRQGWKEDKTIVVPKSQPSNFMLDFRQIQHFSQLESGYQDLWEPITSQTKEIKKNEIELMIVPGLLFDKKGFRVGYGGGYYDRYLEGFTNETLAVTSHRQVIDSVPVDTYDLPVKHIITEEGILF